MTIITEHWYLTNCLCLPRDTGDNFILSPDLSHTLTPLFIQFDEPYSGELTLTGDYPKTVNPETINTLNAFSKMGIRYISGLQSMSMGFGEVSQTVSFFRKIERTPFATLISMVVEDDTPKDMTWFNAADLSLFPENKDWYPLAWVGNVVTPVTPGSEGLIAGWGRYPVDGKTRLISDGLIEWKQLLVNDDYFLDLSQPNYITTQAPTGTVVRVGRGVDSHTLKLDIEVLIA